MRYKQKFYKVVFSKGEVNTIFYCLGYNLDAREEYSAVEIFSNPVNDFQINHHNPLNNLEELQLLGSTCITERSNRAYEINFLRQFFLYNYRQEVTITEL